MNSKTRRSKAVARCIDRIKSIMINGVDVETLRHAKRALMTLAEDAALFTHADFPLPADGEVERTYLIHEETDGTFALYVNSGIKGQSSPPHDHGGSWAIIVAVEGEEIHRLYTCDETSNTLTFANQIVVKPGCGVSLLPDGIHAIEAVAPEPLLHLHLYGRRFADQGTRRQFDLEKGQVRQFVLDDVGFIEDAR
ncbi:MAG: cysteine dioxygenase family protein [Pseudomonadota bacterium]